jgi:tetratricopeptide (TPR) repeat protein
MPLNPKQRLYLVICAGLIAAVAAVYWPVCNYEFIHYDDNSYITENENVKDGLSWNGFKWAFTTGCASNWHPLTWLSLMLDCELFGVKAGPMHVVNVLFHIANTILLFLVFTRITKGIWQSAFIAALFALHPLHVESVAWVTERKDVLSTFFWLFTMLFYVLYVERQSLGRYIAVLVLFAFGLMAKPMLVTLPFVLLLLDYWPLERLGRQKTSVKWLIIEKIPMIVLSVVSSVITFIVQQRGGAVIESEQLLFSERIANTLTSYISYIGKMFWPSRLAVFYPHPVNRIAVNEVAVCAVILILITVVLLYFGRRCKYLAVGWLWYLGTLVPVIGIVQVGAQAMADRYTYIPLIGIFIIIAFSAAQLLEKLYSGKIIPAVLAGVCLVACTVVTSQQLKCWKDSLSLFRHALDVTENNYVMLNNYANVLNKLGRQDEAAAQLAEAVRLAPNSLEILFNYGNMLKDMGKIAQAIEQFEIAIKIKPDDKLSHYGLGLALAAKGDYEGAIKQYQIYAESGTDIADIRQKLAMDLARSGKVDDAVNQFQRAMIINPDSTEVLSNFGYALAQSGKTDEAIKYYEQALANEPNNVITHGRLALALAGIGKIDEAIEHCRIVLAARPDDYEMYTNLGILLQTQGKLDEAIESYRKALKIDPNFKKARENLDAALAQKQSGK